MRDISLLKESNSETNFFNNDLVEKTKLVLSFNKSWRRESISRKSVSSNSTSCTNNLNTFNNSNDIRLYKLSNNNRKSKNKDNNYSKILDIVYQVINDLYEEEIIPSIHEIRRKLNKNKDFSVRGQNLLKICSIDERFKIIKLQSSAPNSKDVQNEWAILLSNKPFNHFNKEVDIELLRLISNYLVFISSYKYYKLTNDVDNDIDHDLFRYDIDNIYNNNFGLYSDLNEHNSHLIYNDNKVINDSNILNDNIKYTRSNSSSDFNIQIFEKQSTLSNLYGINLIPSEHIFNIGGRYLFAEHLKKNGPFKLRNLPLGTIINLIQKLNEIGLLVYKGNCLVPISNSKSAANKYILNLTKSFNKGYLDDIKKKFISLFDSVTKIPLSSLPVVYKRTFGEELNYIDIGYERLSDFIKNEIPSCKILYQSNQYILSITSKSDKHNKYDSYQEKEKDEDQEQQNPDHDQDQEQHNIDQEIDEYKEKYSQTEQNYENNKSKSSNNTKIVDLNNIDNNQISQFDLNLSNTTILYPLKITRF